MAHVTVLGIEINEGVSKKNGQAYSMGALHTMAELAPARGDGNVAKGAMGTTYECPVPLLRKIEHLSFPVRMDLVTRDVMRFRERVSEVVDLLPLEVVKKQG